MQPLIVAIVQQNLEGSLMLRHAQQRQKISQKGQRAIHICMRHWDAIINNKNVLLCMVRQHVPATLTQLRPSNTVTTSQRSSQDRQSMQQTVITALNSLFRQQPAPATPYPPPPSLPVTCTPTP